MNKNHLSTSFATAIGAAAKALARVTGALALIAVALFAVNASANRTITVTSLSGDNATLDFGATDGNAYTLAWGYGDEDGGSATNAWDNFAILGTVAAGDTTRTVVLPAGWANTVTHLRFFLLAPETRPYATRLEYIESTGSQWIDTGVQGKVGVTAEIDLMCLKMSDSAVLGSRTQSGNYRFFVVYWNTYNFLGGIEGNWYYRNFTIVENTRYLVRSVMKSGTQTCSVDGEQIGTHTQTSTFDSQATLALFALHYKDGTAHDLSKARIYSAKIWVENATTGVDELVRDFVPCRDENNEACLYDLVSNAYFRNSGSGTFAEGSVVPLGIEVSAASTLCEPPARSIAIVSQSASAVTLAIGPASGNETYKLYMAYGASDGGATPSDWDWFEEKGEIDAGDNEYDADFPADWGTSVKALRFFLLRSNGAIVSRTDTLLSGELIVAAGSPVTLSASAQYEKVRLRGTLKLTGGTLTTPTVVVDGEDGNLEINGGTYPSSSRLSLDPGLETANEYATVLTLRSGKTTLQNATNANPNVAARIHFLGGSLGCTTFYGEPLSSANGGKWILEGTSSHPIRFGDLGLQRMYWLTGNGSIETRGHCDVVFHDKDYNAEHDYRGTIWLNTPNTVWNHTGNLVLSNAIDVICTSDNCLPSGPQTGGIRFTWVNRGIPAPRLNLNGHSVAVNGIRGTEGYGVTNSSSTVATLRIGEGDTIGAITNLVLQRGNINLVKRGAETNYVSLGSSTLAALRVEAGTLVVTGTTSDGLRAASVTVTEGATLVIDGAAVFAGEVSNNGTIERLNGGTTIMTIGNDGSADTVVWDNPALPEGNALVKVGNNRAIVQTAEALGSDINVQGGSLVFSGRTCTNEWYRFLFNGTHYGSSTNIAIGDLRVYSDINKTENVAKGIGGGGKILSADSDPRNLEPGACVANFATASQNELNSLLGSGAKADLWDLRNAFDDSEYNAVVSKSKYYLYENHQQIWIAFRMAEGKNRVQCYLPAKSSGIIWYLHPSAWLFQTSVDGVNWKTVDTRTGAISESAGYGSTPFVIKGFLADGAAGFDPTANVTVAAGATLDARGVAGGQTLSSLTIDMTAGSGTIRGVTIAQNGVFNLVNIPAGMALRDITLPIVLQDVTDGGNFASWTVLVNGVETNMGVPKWDRETGEISFSSGSTVFILH